VGQGQAGAVAEGGADGLGAGRQEGGKAGKRGKDGNLGKDGHLGRPGRLGHRGKDGKRGKEKRASCGENGQTRLGRLAARLADFASSDVPPYGPHHDRMAWGFLDAWPGILAARHPPLRVSVSPRLRVCPTRNPSGFRFTVPAFSAGSGLPALLHRPRPHNAGGGLDQPQHWGK
jgi:hypothetical protein